VTAIAIVGFGAVSAMGEQWDAVRAGPLGAAALVVLRRDAELAAKGLSHPFAARVKRERDDDGAPAILWKALSSCVAELDGKRPGWRSERVGLVLGTACGDMRASQSAFELLDRGQRVPDIEAPTYFGPMAQAVRRLGLPLDPSMLLLGACASATLAIGLAMRFLQRGACDLILAGGFDEVTDFVAAGFESLRAISASGRPRPFRLDRDGMALGEGAAVLALAPASAPGGLVLRGFGASSDAAHLTAPDREGRALGRAGAAALEEAGGPAIDLVSAHATATPMNDAAEFGALVHALGADEARHVVVHPFKAQIGHTMGAAGALELLACFDAVQRGVWPAAAGSGVMDPATPVRLLNETTPGVTRAVLKLSSAFGGCNAALVLGEHEGSVVGARSSAYVHAAVHVECEPAVEDLARRCHMAVDRVARADGLVRLALAALVDLEEACGPLRGAGVVVGTALATVETNALFAARLRQRGPGGVEPRRFPYTSPNAVAGECSMAFGLTGPSFSVGGGMHAAIEALAAAAVLVEAGDADRMVVVAVDDVGAIARALSPPGVDVQSGAVAVLLTAAGAAASGGRARARVGAITLRRGRGAPATGPAGHRALVPLVGSAPPRELFGVSPPDVVARIVLEPV